jgi:hypothetical protein
LQKAEDLYYQVGPETSEGFDIDHSFDGGTDDWEGPATRHPLPTRPIPVLRSEEAYTYSPAHRLGNGWVLANDGRTSSKATDRAASAFLRLGRSRVCEVS